MQRQTILYYGVLAQLGEHLPYKQRVIGSSPIGPIEIKGGFPSGQRGQTVNLLATLSKVRILLHPLSLTAKPMWLNWQSSWFVISRLSVRVRSSAFKFNIIAGWSSLEARRAHNPKVTGSNPVPATYAQIAQLVEQRTENPRVAGSIPALGISFRKTFQKEIQLKFHMGY